MTRPARFVALLMLVAACGGSSDPTTTSAPPDTDVTSTAPAVTTTTTTVAPAPASTAAPTTTSPPVSSTTSTTAVGTDLPPVFAIVQVWFGPNPYAVIENIGGGTGDVGGHWLCQRPGYFELPSAELAPGEQLLVGLGGEVPDLIGITATADAGRRLGAFGPASGELALYRSGAFDTVTEIVDYVEWGTSGHGRSAIAVAAGIWPEDAFVAMEPEALGMRTVSTPADGPDGWLAEIGG
jgi:hypothetical protein